MSKQQKIATWTPDPPVRMKVVHTGWLPDDYGCPHCKKTMTGVLVSMLEGLDYWWLCSCGGGREIREVYADTKWTHDHSVEYYELCAWKIQERTWPD